MYTRKKSKFQIRQVKLRFIVIILLLFLSLPFWNGKQAHSQQDKAVELDGVWRLRGYGKILHIHQGSYTSYDIRKISCLQVSKGTLRDFKQRFDRFVIHDTETDIFENATLDTMWRIQRLCRYRVFSLSVILPKSK